VKRGAIYSGISIQNHFNVIKSQRKNIEYIAQFLRKRYFLILSTLLTVICLTTIAHTPFQISIRGIDIVKAKAQSTPSIEKVASITSR